MTDKDLSNAIARIRELLPKVSEGPWERMEYGKQILPYSVATTDGHYNSVQCLIARGTPTGGNGWPVASIEERIANAELICLLRNNIEAILELLATAYTEGQQSTMKFVSEESKRMCARIEQGKEPLGYKDRVRLEKRELDEKIVRLKAFLESGHSLQDDERTRMEDQFRTMCVYSEILGERIAAFSTPPPATSPSPAKQETTSEVRLTRVGSE